MNHHLHGHVYRPQREADRVIALFGRKPPAPVREQIRELLWKEREHYLALTALRHRSQARSRERPFERER